MNWLTRFFSRSDDDTFIEGYRLGLQHGMDDYEKAFLLDRFRSAEASYPDPEHENVVSLARHRSWIPRGGAA